MPILVIRETSRLRQWKRENRSSTDRRRGGGSSRHAPRDCPGRPQDGGKIRCLRPARPQRACPRGRKVGRRGSGKPGPPLIAPCARVSPSTPHGRQRPTRRGVPPRPGRRFLTASSARSTPRASCRRRSGPVERVTRAARTSSGLPGARLRCVADGSEERVRRTANTRCAATGPSHLRTSAGAPAGVSSGCPSRARGEAG
jgi:hypothetical protein